MTDAASVPRRISPADAGALIGMLAILEGELQSLQTDAVPHWAKRIGERFKRDGLVSDVDSGRQVRQALNDLNHRLRYVLGEYEAPPTSSPVP